MRWDEVASSQKNFGRKQWVTDAGKHAALGLAGVV